MKKVIGISIFLSVFFVAFCLLYNPFGIFAQFTSTGFGYFSHILMLGCVVFLGIFLSRTLKLLAQPRFHFTSKTSVAWALSEMLFIACFFALYICLFCHISYVEALALGLRYSFLILVYPILYFAITYKASVPAHDDAIVKFFDEHKRLKLSVTSDSVLFISAETNYINIYYLEGGRIRNFLLRNSMKSQEENIASFGFVRCHRSYIVNPRHVTVLRKEKDGPISAVLDCPDAPAVPVSKQYYDALSSLL